LASSKIAFASYAGHWQIFTVNADGAGMHRLTDLPTDQFHPAWSPNGTRIAFDAQSQGGPFEIDVMNADGSGLERLTDGPGWNNLPDWSPEWSTDRLR
jgi:TolB protein